MSLTDRLKSRIRASGPISIADYMTTCLLDPRDGYYTTRPPFGAKGDFITAPEISQMFGELLGLALAQAWVDQGRPDPFVLAELGPGRGTLMADLWRATGAVDGFREAAQVWLVEASPRLREIQKETLTGVEVRWATGLGELPIAPLFLIANEFFDALPIRQFVRQDSGWRERVIGLKDDALSFGLSPTAPVPELDHRADAKAGAIVETCAPGQAIAAQIGARITENGGAAILIDYGDWRSLGDTFQAMSGHAYTDPLAAPGQADLTAHVDFEALSKALAPAKVSAMTPQGVLLARLGIVDRAKALAKGQDDASLDAHEAAFHRLTSADQMGTLFKAVAAYPDGAPAPPGFDP